MPSPPRPPPPNYRSPALIMELAAIRISPAKGSVAGVVEDTPMCDLCIKCKVCQGAGTCTLGVCVVLGVEL